MAYSIDQWQELSPECAAQAYVELSLWLEDHRGSSFDIDDFSINVIDVEASTNGLEIWHVKGKGEFRVYEVERERSAITQLEVMRCLWLAIKQTNHSILEKKLEEKNIELPYKDLINKEGLSPEKAFHAFENARTFERYRIC